ncbi:energy transducer TonB [Stenotrophomonas maltophilia]|uniref:energy transducer TonB n=1 Tax=Stenotrophomonas maltophilia TaxID=40324 RepID=UPI0012FD8700|nr:energy transducer TonB [Stenotrophomonas maltophilia]
MMMERVMRWSALAVMLLAGGGCSPGYDAGAACGSLAEPAPVRDAGVEQLQASQDDGRCTFRAQGRDAAALQRQQRMLDALAIIACGQPAQVQPVAGTAGFELQMPPRCPLSARSSLFVQDDPRWTLDRPSMPDYPAAARADRQEGIAHLRLLLDDEGRVKAAIVATSSGHPLLDEAAGKAALGWRSKREWWAFSTTRMSLVRTTVAFAAN